MSKKSLGWIVLVAVLTVAGVVGIQGWRSMQNAVPKGIAYGNGRIEAKLVDVSTKEPLRVKEILVDEGKLVMPGDVLVRMDTSTLESQLAEAKATVAATEERTAASKSAIIRCQGEFELAETELERTRTLFEKKVNTQADLDRRTKEVKVTKASLEEAEATLRTAQQQVEVAQNNVATIQTRIDDATLTSPVRGRVLYRLAENGEVLAAGGKALTLVNLEDVYMEIFLPAGQASSLKIGDEARITVDHAPGKAAAGFVSFVSPEAQFTPKQVETRSERDKLMFRVKIRVPDELVTAYIERIKTGVRGIGYVKVDADAVWPNWLQDLVAPPLKPEDLSTSSTQEPIANQSAGTGNETDRLPSVKP
ncbi:HlyD family secretion protein [Schlesneria paludicola]|uniref:HlyD family secretion protein n=1 Tax=Schlesneria paludicola TaxID=360056 RepID=UPI00029A5368|nr:HlyD family efflux transporter periplasmic adaptor subunit [Schlesneria paludicola]